MKILFLCTGNYYRSRLAEELLRNYAAIGSVSLDSDSAGLGPIPNPINIGPIRFEVVEYLKSKGMTSSGAQRFPKKCTVADIESSNVVIGMNEVEHRHMIEAQFPNVSLAHVKYWHVPDMEEDPEYIGPRLMDRNVFNLLNELSNLKR